MTELTDEAVRNLNQILQQLAQQQPAGPSPGPSPGPTPPTVSGQHTAEDVRTLEKAHSDAIKAIQEHKDELEKLEESYNTWHDSISKDFADATATETEAILVRKAATAALLVEQEKLLKAGADGTDATAEQTAELHLVKVALRDAARETKRLEKGLKEAAKKAGAEKGLAEHLSRLGGKVTGLQLKSGGLGDNMKQLGVKFGDVKKSGGSMTKSLMSAGKAMGKNFLLAAADKLVGATMDLVKAQDKAISSFRKATGAGKEYNLEITKLERNNRYAGVTAEKAGKAYNTLFDNFSAFTQLNKSERSQVAKTTTLLSELGVSGADTAKIFDQMTRSLGMGIDETNDVVLRLAGTAKSLGVSMGKMSKDFGAAFKELSKYGKGAIDVFEGLAKQSKATGIAVSNLMGLAKQFDTFDSAAKSVGRLNAIMGGPYLNSIDMLNATEAERIDLLKASVDAAGIQFDHMERFEKQAIASAMGMSVEDASRIMGMNTAEMELQALQQEELAELAQNSQEIMAQIKNAFASMLVDMRPFIENFIVPLVEALGKFGRWMGNAESGLTRFISMGLLAAGVAALIAAPFTGGTSLAAFALVAGLIGGTSFAVFGGGGGGEEGAGGGTDEVASAFHASGGVVRRKANGGSLSDRAKTAVGINESGAERIVVPYGTYVATAADTKRSNDLASELIKEVQGLRQDLSRGGDQPAKIVIEDTEFAATIVNSSGIGPFGAISRMV
jgi:hypothetical protein